MADDKDDDWAWTEFQRLRDAQPQMPDYSTPRAEAAVLALLATVLTGFVVGVSYMAWRQGLLADVLATIAALGGVMAAYYALIRRFIR